LYAFVNNLFSLLSVSLLQKIIPILTEAAILYLHLTNKCDDQIFQ